VAVTIRRARIDDVDACFAVQKSADLAAFPHIFPPELFPFPDEEVRARWRENLVDGDRYCVVAEDEGTIIGTAVLIGDFFDSVAVVPERWGSAVASDLYEVIIARAQTLGLARLHLWVIEKNERARHLYESRGWRLDGRKKELPFPPHPLVISYTLDLPSTPL